MGGLSFRGRLRACWLCGKEARSGICLGPHVYTAAVHRQAIWERLIVPEGTHPPAMAEDHPVSPLLDAR